MTLAAELAVAIWLGVGQKSKLADGDGREGKVEGAYTCRSRKTGEILFER